MKNITFDRLHDISTTITFNKKWRTEDGKLCNAVKGINSFKIEPGDIASSMDEFGNIIILIGTSEKSNAVIYERIVDQQRQIVSCETVEFANLVELTTDASLTGILDEIKILAICETISRGLAYTRSDWAERASALSPWSVV